MYRQNMGMAWARILAVGLLAAFRLAATEHRGQVTFGGLAVPGATITVTQGEKRSIAVTDAQGVYRFADLPDGTWAIRVEMLCFSPIDREIVVKPDAPSAVWELKLLPMAEIQAAAGPPVKATPPPSAATPQPTQTASAEPAAKPDAPKSSKRTKLAPPANPQNGFQRADLNASADASKLTADAPDPSQSAADGLMVNGSVNNGAASPFAQSAAFGNNRKGARSLYQGSVGVVVDNAALDARSFSLTGQDTPKPAYNHMQGFASFGGPLYIPHLMRPSRTPLNFFVGYQWQHNRNASNQSALMPTLAQRAGDFSQAITPLGVPVHIVDPTTGQPFAGNMIPQSRLSPQALSLLKFYPLPEFNAGQYNYQVPLVGI